jgi:hypothetical protein
VMFGDETAVSENFFHFYLFFLNFDDSKRFFVDSLCAFLQILSFHSNINQ